MKHQELQDQDRRLADALQLRDPIDRRGLLAEAGALANSIYRGDGAAVAQILRHLYPQMFQYGALRDHAAHLHTALDCPYPIHDLILRLITLPRPQSGTRVPAGPNPNDILYWIDPRAETHPPQEIQPISLPHRDHYTAMLHLAMEKRDPIDISTALRALNYHLFVEHITDPDTWANLDLAIKAIITRHPPDPSLTDP